MDFQTFHRYRHLADKGLVEQLRCNTCDTVYVLRMSKDNDPVFQCLTCDTLVQPGLRVWEKIRAILSEFE